MKLSRVFLATALAISLPLAACSKKDPIEKVVSMMEDLGDAVDSAKGDCGKMADAVQSVADKYKGDLEGMKSAAESAKKDKDQAKALMEKYGDRIQKVMPKMMGMMKCADDPKMKAVSDKLEGLLG